MLVLFLVGPGAVLDSLIGYSTEFRSPYKYSMTDSMGGKAASAVQSRMNFAA